MNRLIDRIGGMFAAERAKKTVAEFEALDASALARLSDKELAQWQATQPKDSPQAIWAQYEWSRRLTVAQIKATRWAAWMGIVGVVVGIVLIKVIEWLEHHKGP